MNRHEAGQAPPDTAAVAAQLEHILGSETFASTPLLSRFLKYVVEHGIRADPTPLKEYTLGVEVFDRGDDFDPRADTIVRVNARRLRARLADYYRGEGRRDPVVIEMPKGHYVATARAATRQEIASADEATPKRRREDRMSPAAGTGATPPVSLPAPRTALVGREQMLADVRARLTSEPVRLLTLTGTGGSGKTRLALEAAWQSLDDFPGGIVFVNLAATSDADALSRAVAQALGVRRADGGALDEAIAVHLRGTLRAPMLLVLDNLEQLGAHTALVGTLLDACASLRILATSRVALHIYGEHEFPVEPLALPERDPLPSLETLAQNEAVRLFLARAQAANPDFALDADNAAATAELCCRLDGLPLAIELVAARARELGPAAMLERFSGHLDLPAHAARDLPARQRTLRRTVDWSHALLDERQQVLLRRLAVFAGGFTAEAAEAVADCAGDLGLDIEAGLAALVDNNLLYLAATEPEPRYAKLVTIRAYVLERLAASADEALVRRAHAAYMLVLAEEGLARLEDDRREAWLARCDREQDNFRTALDGLLQRGEIDWALRIGHALFAYWERREHLAEGHRYLQAILAGCGPDTAPELRAAVEYQATILVAFHGDLEATAASYRRLLDTHRQRGDRKGEALALTSLAVNVRNLGDDAQARRYFEQALALYRELGATAQIAGTLSNLAGVLAGDDPERARGLLREARALFLDVGQPVSATWCGNHLADVARAQGEYKQADRLYREAETGFRQLGDQWGTGRSLLDRGLLALERDRPGQARTLFLEALQIFCDLDHRRGVAQLLDGCMRLALHAGDHAGALRLAGAAQALRRTTHALAHRKQQLQLDQLLAQARAGLEPKAARQHFEAGLGMSYQQAIAFALSLLQIDDPAPSRTQ